MNAVADLTLAALNERGTTTLEHYGFSLRSACAAHPPPFGMAWYGDKYRNAACDPNWFATSLIANAAKEGEGSQKLWTLVACTDDSDIAEKIRIHAIDESRHARLYIAMLEIAFPEAVSNKLRPTLYALSPGYSLKDRPSPLQPLPQHHVLDEIIQMNIGEIRTRIHQLLLRPVIMTYCPLKGQKKLQKILDSLLEDETRHIEYTAQLIEKESYRGFQEFVQDTMSKRLDEFNNITLDEVGELTFD